MRVFILIISISVIFIYPLSAQKILYSSDAYTLNQNAVYQGQYEAGAVSAFEIKSNYESAFRRGTKRVVTFKFSINGLDNERPQSLEHMVLLEPEEGNFVTPVFTFGEDDPDEIDWPDEDETYFASNEKVDVLFRVNMRKVLRDFKTKGFYQTHNGSIINKESFNGVYIVGNESPLSWDFDHLVEKNQFKLTDAENDSIFEINITFDANPERPINSDGYSEWKLTEDISHYPQLTSSHTLIDALYNLSLEELSLDIRPDSTFMTGAKWPGLWTRDISYSILLALAITNPDVSKKSLMAKVRDGRIIQDMGTGGSWPISSDRMTWALAAWEVYVVTGDKEWLHDAFQIIKNSTAVDLKTLIDPQTGLFYGESSFLDWRSQSYPQWMDAKDIYMSLNLGTNAVHCQTYQILANMAMILGEPYQEFHNIAESIKQAINAYFWMSDKGYYGQYLYGRNYNILSPRFETLGEALSILFSIAGNLQQQKIIESTPLLDFGTPCIFPQI
ncbi:MAG: glycogen debranching protein, partial [Calditrichia bacterium]